MKFITDIQEANIALKQYKSSIAQICMFSLSLRRLALRLQSPKTTKVLYVIGAGCEHITGNFKWDNSNLSIITEPSKNSSEIRTKIVDERAGFELITSGGFSLALGQVGEFGRSFENFFKEETR
jgi:hypothetical protein